MDNQKLIAGYTRLLEEIERIEGRLMDDGRVDPRRKISQILDIIETARFSMDNVGINSTGPVHQGRELLTRILNAGGSVTITALDYTNDVFRERERQELDRVGRLVSELGTTFAVLHEIYQKNPKADMKIYLHTFPKAALTIGGIDDVDGQMQVNVYPEGTGVRGLMGKTYLIKSEDVDAFKAGKDFYFSLLDESIPIPCSDIARHRNDLNIIEASKIRPYL